ncbi:hypothetical protein HY945_02900, partial [Candidatus Gottesmanbacteria bacterium]|nr:hypothetical protein [Candidatus Gottesmanbacteria bacterium]
QRFGETLLQRGDAVGGVVLDIAGGWTEEAEGRFDDLVRDQRVVKGVKRIYRDGGNIILTDGMGADLPRFVKMGQKHAILEVGTSARNDDGEFADYRKGPNHVLGQMVGVNVLIPSSSATQR